MEDVKVGDLMTRNYVSVGPEDTLQKCAKTMIKKRVGGVLVESKDELKGIITEKDIVWAIVKKKRADLSKILVKDLMKKKVRTIKPSANVAEVLERMRKTKHRRFPVVEKGKLVGIITLKDILKINPNLYEMIADTVKIKEHKKKMKKGGDMRMPVKKGYCEECGKKDLLYKDDDMLVCMNCYEGK